MGRFGLCYGPFRLYDGPLWTMFLEIKIFEAVLVGAVLAMGRFGIDPKKRPPIGEHFYANSVRITINVKNRGLYTS